MCVWNHLHPSLHNKGVMYFLKLSKVCFHIIASISKWQDIINEIFNLNLFQTYSYSQALPDINMYFQEFPLARRFKLLNLKPDLLVFTDLTMQGPVVQKFNLDQNNLDLEIPCFVIQDQVIHFTCVVFQSKIGLYHPDSDTHFFR